MPYDVQLLQLVKNLRAEAGHSLAVAQGQGTEETLRYVINRTQQELYDAFQWPHLKLHRTFMTNAAARYYNYPADIPFDNVTAVWAHTKSSSDWRLLPKGISPADFTIYDSNAGVSAFPPQKWDHDADRDQIELWPIPSTDTGEVWVYGLKPLVPMLKNTDTCMLDSNLIVMFAAVEVVDQKDKNAAERKNQKAQRHLQKLLGKQGGRKRAWTSLTQGSSAPGVLGLDFIPEGFVNGHGRHGG